MNKEEGVKEIVKRLSECPMGVGINAIAEYLYNKGIRPLGGK